MKVHELQGARITTIRTIRKEDKKLEMVSISKLKEKPIPTPTEDKWYKVDPMSIEWNRITNHTCKTVKQMNTRQFILEAYRELKDNPKKYGIKFYTKVIEKTWKHKTVEELRAIARTKGNDNINRIEKGLQLAQRIQNGESWESICDEPDTAKWVIMVLWGKDKVKLIGGSTKAEIKVPPSDIDERLFNKDSRFDTVVPEVVRYEPLS